MITNENLIPIKKFHPIQLKVFFTMTTLYTFYFAVNYNLGPATKYIQDAFNISSQRFGILFTVFTIIFALGQFVAGYLGDRFSPKKMMLIGATGGIISNFLFGMSGSLTYFTLFWGLNALFLSFGWSPGCSILFNWLPESKWGTFMGIYNAFSFMGGVIVYPLAGFAITHFGWRAAFFIPPVLLLLWTLVFSKNVTDAPEDLGFEVEWKTHKTGRKDKSQNQGQNKSENDQAAIGLNDYLKVLKHPTMNLIYVSAICSQFVRWGLVNWVVKILIEPVSSGGYGLSLVLSAAIASAMHWGGAFFSILMGYISDVVFKGQRWQVIFTGFLVSGFTLLIMYRYNSNIMSVKYGLQLLVLILFVAGGCIQGLQAPIFNLPGDILGSRLGGTGVGITNGWSYIGASLSGIALGWLLDSYGLMSGILLMAFVSIIGAVFILIVRR